MPHSNSAASSRRFWARMWPLIGNIRKTDEEPPRISVIDVASTITNLDAHSTSETIRAMSRTYPEVALKSGHFKFPGRRQRDTPVADLPTIIEIIFLLPGKTAARIRSEAAKLLVRYLGGDLCLVEEIQNLRHVQEELKKLEPNHPFRVFGEAIETELEKFRPLIQEEVESALQKAIKAARATCRIDFCRGVSKNGRDLREIGILLEGDEGRRIIEEEGMIAVTVFLRQSLPAERQKFVKHFTHSFSKALKAKKLEQCLVDNTKPYLQEHMGEARIAYMEADRELMASVLQANDAVFQRIESRHQ